MNMKIQIKSIFGILKSNESEFPDDGWRKSQERAEAFEFAKNAALKLE